MTSEVALGPEPVAVVTLESVAAELAADRDARAVVTAGRVTVAVDG